MSDGVIAAWHGDHWTWNDPGSGELNTIEVVEGDLMVRVSGDCRDCGGVTMTPEQAVHLGEALVYWGAWGRLGPASIWEGDDD